MEPSEIAGQPGPPWATGPGTAAAEGAGPGAPTLPPPGDLVPGGDLGGLGDLGVLGQIEGELADVERALERLDEGSYGTCERCGRPISADRLETSPATRLCADHAG